MVLRAISVVVIACAIARLSLKASESLFVQPELCLVWHTWASMCTADAARYSVELTVSEHAAGSLGTPTLQRAARMLKTAGFVMLRGPSLVDDASLDRARRRTPSCARGR